MSIHLHLFRSISGMTPKYFSRIFRYFRDFSSAWEKAGKSDFRKAGIESEDLISAILLARRSISPEAEACRLRALSIDTLSFSDSRYPSLLKEIRDPPLLLYVRGSISCLGGTCLAVVGSRTMTPYGKEVIERFFPTFALNGFTIVSGLAYGVDACSHREALRQQMPTIAVLGSGIDRMYPPEHKDLAQKISEHGALISEFPPGTLPKAEHFPMRNRIISGLSLGTLLIEAKDASGALITADFSLSQNREIFAVPGSIFADMSRGTNQLIQKGEALLTTQALDILDVFRHQPLFSSMTRSRQQSSKAKLQKSDRQPNAFSLSSQEQTIFNALSHSPCHPDALSRETGISPQEMSQILSLLELKQYTSVTATGCYIRRDTPRCHGALRCHPSTSSG
ncbi:DNA-protecting protein DprA [Candidatus Peregrinibacteria bacterium]|nr:DNA-protecting protein DprA [Candidatus Peregrinibacteria bacterium]